MEDRRGRSLSMLAAVLLVTSCTGGDDASPTTTEPPSVPVDETTTTTSPTVDTTTTTTTTPVGPPMISQGDVNDTVAAFQWLLNCGGFANLTIDGSFGPATRAAIEAADGHTDEETFARLSRECSDPRPLSPDIPSTVVGYAEPGTPAEYLMSLTLGKTLSVVGDGADVTVIVVGADGAVIEPDTESTWPIITTMDYLIQVEAGPTSGTFTLTVEADEGTPTSTDWLLTTSAISNGDTRLAIGDPADETIADIFEFLGHGPRGSLGEFDTGWDFPGQEGFRGILIEGFRFLFYGPNDDFPDRPETLARIRVVEPTVDANGDPRPPFYVTTPEGVGVGHTLADLTTVYGTFVRAGSNAAEHYYRLVNAGGELCFYFGASAPTESSVIVEISTECRR